MKKNKVFVVEDEQGIAELMRVVLIDAGFNVALYSTGDKVLKALRLEKPELIISDLWLPGMDGAELVKQIRTLPKGKEVPVVLISAQDKLHKISKKIKANGFLAKPFEIEDLVAVVEEHCG